MTLSFPYSRSEAEIHKLVEFREFQSLNSLNPFPLIPCPYKIGHWDLTPKIIRNNMHAQDIVLSDLNILTHAT
jgi:hypothetical protein